MIMMNEGITMKPVHTPQSVPPPLPLMFVCRSGRAPFPSLPGDAAKSAFRAEEETRTGRGRIRNAMPRETEKGTVLFQGKPTESATSCSHCSLL